MTNPAWAPYAVSSDAASYPVHNAPPRVPGPDLIAFTWQQLQQIVAGFVNEFLRQVAVALGAIEIFGFRPYEALVEIGEQISAATANFNALLTGFGLPTMDDVAELLANQATDFADFLAATGQATLTALGDALADLIAFLTSIPAALISGTTAAQQTLQDALNQALNPLAAANASAAAVAAQVQTSLQGIIPAVVQNANGTATALTSAITMNSNGTATYVSNGVHALVDQANGTMASVAQSFQSAAQAAITQTGNNLTAAAVNVQNVVNSLFGAFGIGAGADAPASTPAQATQAVVSAQQNIADTAAGLAALNALLNQAQNGGGTSVSVNFSDYADGSLPASFTAGLSGSLVAGGSANPIEFAGTPTISGGYAVDAAGVTAFTGVGAAYSDAATVGDQQIISAIFTGTGLKALVGRCNSARTSYVTAFTDGALWALCCVVGGTFTQLGYIRETWAAGAAYSLVCGTGPSANRNFQLLKNGSPLTWSTGSTTLTESGTTSQMGASYRYCGFGVDSPAKLSQWTFADNAPPAAVGSGFRAYKSSGSTVVAAGVIGGTVYDTVETNTPDLSYNSSNNRLTISVDGWYLFNACADVSGATTLACAKNGTIVSRGLYSSSNGATSVTVPVYCAAGDYLQPALSVTQTVTSGQTFTFWSVAFMNRGTLS